MRVLKIRYNTDYKEDNGSKPWRLIEEGSEQIFADHIEILCKTETTKDYIENIGYKWHITCYINNISFYKEGGLLKIKLN